MNFIKKVMLCLCSMSFLQADPYPISFCIPEIKIVDQIPEKTRDFAFLIPGDLNTYIYKTEDDYYKGYQSSYYAITKKKGGWDCLRHYEILANGCIPYFLDLDKCDSQTMYFLPKDLLREAMKIEGVSPKGIDHKRFNRAKYYEILAKLIDYTRRHLTTKRMAEYVLQTIGYSGEGKILFLSKDASPDYLRCLLLVGMKELLQDRIVDFPKIGHIYTNYSGEPLLYGRGFTYTKIVDDLPINRENIAERIRNKEFDLIIYGSIHRGCVFHDLVKKVYKPEEIIYFCGEDAHKCRFFRIKNLFLREFTQ